MSYSFLIGEAVPVYTASYNEYLFGWDVERIDQDQAPVFDNDDITGKSNGRHPSYGVFEIFTKKCVVYSLFFEGDYPLIDTHPGITFLLPHHLAEIDSAILKWKHPGRNQVPGFGPGQDPWLARLIWFQWWFGWAIKNCRFPAIQNY